MKSVLFVYRILLPPLLLFRLCLAGPADAESRPQLMARISGTESRPQIMTRPTPTESRPQIMTRPTPTESRPQILTRPTGAESRPQIMTRPSGTESRPQIMTIPRPQIMTIPSGTESRHQIMTRRTGTESRREMAESGHLHGLSPGLQNNREELLFGMHVNHRNEDTVFVQDSLTHPSRRNEDTIFVQDSLTSEKIKKETWMFRPNTESQQKTKNVASDANKNYPVSSRENSHTRQTTRLSSQRLNHHNLNMTQLHPLKNVTPHWPLTKDEIKKKYRIKQLNITFNEELSEMRFQLPLGSRSPPSDKPGYGHIVRYRTRRSLKQITPPNPLKHSAPRQIPPEYMIRLFQLLSGTHYQMMRNVVVTGFLNINDEEDYLEGSGNSLQQVRQLVFDASVRQEAKAIKYAELRLHVAFKNRETGTEITNETIVDGVSQLYDLSIFEVDPHFGHVLIASRSIQNAHRTWVTFNLTSAVQRWENSGLRVLEAKVSFHGNRTQFGDSSDDFDANGISDYVLDIDVQEGKEPLLVVFSTKSEVRDQVTHQIHKRDAIKRRVNESQNNNDFPDILNNLLTDGQNVESLVNFISTKGIESPNNGTSKRINVSQNNKSTFSHHYPRNDTNKEKNTLYRNEDNRTFLKFMSSSQRVLGDFIMDQSTETDMTRRQKTRHIDVYDNRNYTFPTTRFLKENLHPTSTENEEIKLQEDSIRLRVRRDTKRRYRRHLDSLFNEQLRNINKIRYKRSKKKRHSCQRGELYVDFETIKWDKAIFLPAGYQAFECTGKCYTPIGEYLSPTKHAIIQTLVHTSYPELASRACCVPTKLDPISILYWDENGDIQFDYSHEGMVVAECGCR